MPTIRKPLFVIPADLGAIVCSEADTGHPVSNLNRHRDIGLTWRTNGSASAWARGQFPSETSVDFLAIVAANAQVGTQYRLRLGTSQAEVDGTAPYDSGTLDFIAVAPAVTPSDRLYHSHLELDEAEAATWWRIDISDHTGDFEAASVVMGAAIEPSHFYNADFEYGVEDLGQLEIGRFGVMDDTPGNIWRTIDFALGWQSEAEFETEFRPLMERLGQREVLYCCFDPEATAYRQARTYMGILKRPLFARGMRKPRTFLQEFSILSFI